MSLKVVFVIVAALCAFVVLVGFGDVDAVKVLAAGLLAAAVAIVVP